MYLQFITSIFVVIVVKAIWESNWMRLKKEKYNHPGILFGPKKLIVRMYLWITKMWTTVLLTTKNLSTEEKSSPILCGHNLQDNNVVYFNGIAEHGKDTAAGTALIVKLVMRSNSQADLTLFLQVPGYGILQHPLSPNVTTCCSSESDVFRAEGIVIERLEPMRRWKLSYHGLMRMIDTCKESSKWNEAKNLVYVRFKFQWTSYSSPYNFIDDLDNGLFSDAIAREPWSVDFFQKIKSFPRSNNLCEQWGELRGNVYVDGMEEGCDGRQITLRGVKSISAGSVDTSRCRRYFRVNALLENGISLSMIILNSTESFTHALSGYVVSNDQRLSRITWSDFCLWKHGENENLPDVIQFNIQTEQQKYNVVCLLKRKPLHYCGLDWKGKNHECIAEVYIDSQPGKGLVEFYYSLPNESCPMERTIKRPSFTLQVMKDDQNTLIASLNEQQKCRKQLLVGAKAGYLSYLKTKLSNCNIAECFVPDGFCVTTNAYDLHLQKNPDLQQLIHRLHNVLRHENKDEVYDLTQKCFLAFANSSIPSSLICEIKDNFEKLKSHKNTKLLVAVRYSSIETCKESISSPTVLGVSCINQVLSAILKCWGFQFTYEALCHRRKHGLPFVSGMSIIIQTIVENQRASGVMYTCEPKNGDPSQTIIDVYSNHSKVQDGNVASDRFVLKKHNNETYIVVSHIVNKQSSSGFTSTRNNQRAFAKRSCLSYDDLSKLSKVSESLKQIFQSEMTIKWKISSSGKVFVLQLTPLILDFPETEHDLLHEFDTARPSKDKFTIPYQENDILPEIITPLTASIIHRAAILGLQNIEETVCGTKVLPFSDVYLTLHKSRVLIDQMDVSRSYSLKHFFVGSSNDYLPSVEKHSIGITNLFYKSWCFLKILLKTRRAQKELRQLEKQTESLKLLSGCSKDVHENITQSIVPVLSKAIECHVMCTARFYLCRKLLQLFLCEPDRDATNCEHLISKWLGSYSNDAFASVPNSLQRLSDELSDQKEEFLALKPLKADGWLKSNTDEKVRRAYDEFMTNHGHRCLHESEMRELSWRQDPSKIITPLKAILERETTVPRSEKLDDYNDITSLNLSLFESIMLKFLLPITRQVLSLLRSSLSTYIRNLDAFKQAYSYMATQLQREMKLPDEDLLYFLTHREIGKLIESFRPDLVTKSIQRRHVYCNEINANWNDIANTVENRSTGSTIESPECKNILRGISVFPKKVCGPARVLTDVSDAFLIQADEILIVRHPDVGWSPFFPIVAGLVTEVGTMSSCGSSIGREFGLPCIVGVQDATKRFATGEIIILDGYKGIIKPARLAVKEE